MKKERTIPKHTSKIEKNGSVVYLMDNCEAKFFKGRLSNLHIIIDSKQKKDALSTLKISSTILLNQSPIKPREKQKQKKLRKKRF